MMFVLGIATGILVSAVFLAICIYKLWESLQ